MTGKYLSQVRPDETSSFSRPSASCSTAGARRFGTLTREHLPEEGDALQVSARDLARQPGDVGPVDQLRDPRLGDHRRGAARVQGQGSRPPDHDPPGGQPAGEPEPEPLQEEKVGPTLGEDTIAKGVFAIWVSMLVVPIFMLVYYRFAGLVAVIALVLNMILLIGSMAFMQATFSLPGLAGLALTIGMAVDANVLVFERMREEKERGAGMAQQIRNGFNRAWVTIFDSHVTNLLSAVVLYIVGTEEVKGFALTMIIGMLWNLFTAVFMSRVIFEFCYEKGWLKKLTMLKMMDKTNIDFIGPRHFCMAGSVILIVLGLVAFFARGRTMYNIDFTGGTLVTIRLNEDDPSVKELSESSGRTSSARRRACLPDVTVESLNVGDDKRLARFNIRTTENEQPEQGQEPRSSKSFGTALERVEMTAGEPQADPPRRDPDRR